MSQISKLNHLVREARPFWPEKPFINPDKAIVKHELPFTSIYRDTFAYRGFKEGGVFEISGLSNALARFKAKIAGEGK